MLQRRQQGGAALPDRMEPRTDDESPPMTSHRQGEDAAHAARALAGRYRPSPLAVLVACAYFMEFLDGSIIATALPHMARSLHTSAVALNIGMSAYLMTVAVCILPSSWAARRFGARAVFSLAIALFTLASALCGLAGSVGGFVAFRILQGVGGAMMVPVGRLCVLRETPKHHLMGAIAVLTWPGLVAPVIAPPLGGFLADHLSWRAIFFLNIPLGLAGCLASLRWTPAGADRAPARFDATGFALAALACLSASLLLDDLGAAGSLRPRTALLALVLATTLAWLPRHLRRAAQPLVSLDGLSVASFRLVVYAGSVMRMLISTMPFLLPLMFELGYGMNATRAGLLLLALFAGNIGIKPLTTPILRRFGFRRVIVVNGLLQAATMLACALLPRLQVAPLTACLLVASGASRSLQFTALNTLAFAEVPQPAMEGANALFSVAFQLSLGFGIAIGASSLRLARLLPGLGARGGPAPFDLALVAIAAAMALVSLYALRLHPQAGSVVSRRGRG